MKHTLKNRRSGGFTIVELMISLSVLTLLAMFSGRIYLNYTASTRDLKAANLIYEEGRQLMERIVREVRSSGLDYEQYFNQNVLIPIHATDFPSDPPQTYTDNYCYYGTFFTDNGPDGNPLAFEDNESTGFRNTDIEDAITDLTGYNLSADAVAPIEKELYLINIPGTQRTILKRIERTESGQTIGKISMVKLIGKDFGEDHINRTDSYNGAQASEITCADTDLDTREGDGLIDTWHCHADYNCSTNTLLDADIYSTGCVGFGHTADNDNGFVDISPSALNVVDFQLIVSPKDDPWKAYNMDGVQIQPHVTIRLTVEANPLLVALTDEGRIPSITLTSTVTARNYDEIKSPCFL